MDKRVSLLSSRFWVRLPVRVYMRRKPMRRKPMRRKPMLRKPMLRKPMRKTKT